MQTGHKKATSDDVAGEQRTGRGRKRTKREMGEERTRERAEKKDENERRGRIKTPQSECRRVGGSSKLRSKKVCTSIKSAPALFIRLSTNPLITTSENTKGYKRKSSMKMELFLFRAPCSFIGQNGYAILTSIVTPDGSERFVRASITFALGSRMSMMRLWIRISNCSRASL